MAALPLSKWPRPKAVHAERGHTDARGVRGDEAPAPIIVFQGLFRPDCSKDLLLAELCSATPLCRASAIATAMTAARFHEMADASEA